jgi:hypothetical protein
VSWAEFAVRVAEATGLDAGLVRPGPASEMGWPAERPAYVALGTERGQLMPSFESALASFAAEIARDHARSDPDEREHRAGMLRGDEAPAVPAE